MTRTLLMLAALMLCGCSGDNNEVMAVLAASMLTACNSNKQTTDNDMKQELNLVQEWDKVFPKSDKVDHKKVTFTNLFGITLAADMYTPKGATGKLPAIAVCGPFGAVKEQSSGLYAQTMPRSSSRTTTTTIRPRAATTSVAATPPTVGPRAV